MGTIDEYRLAESQGGRLVAWSQSVWRGDTIRGMWFYQRAEARHVYVYPHTHSMHKDALITQVRWWV